jgi:hypothetical protein
MMEGKVEIAIEIAVAISAIVAPVFAFSATRRAGPELKPDRLAMRAEWRAVAVTAAKGALFGLVCWCLCCLLWFFV